MSQSSIEASLARAEHLLRMGRSVEGEQLAGQLVAADPASVRALGLLAWAQARQSKFDECIDTCGALLAQSPRDQRGRQLLSMALAELGRHDQAIAIGEGVVADFPHNAGAHHNLARRLRRAGDLPRSLVHAQRAVQLDPHDADFYVGLAETYNMMGRRKRAGLAFDRALELDPTHATALAGKADHLNEQEQIAPALAATGSALAQNPRQHTARRVLRDQLRKSVERQFGVATLALAAMPFIVLKFREPSSLPGGGAESATWVRFPVGLAVLAAVVWYAGVETRRLPVNWRRDPRMWWRNLNWRSRTLAIVAVLTLPAGIVALLYPHAPDAVLGLYVLPALVLPYWLSLFSPVVGSLKWRMTEGFQDRGRAYSEVRRARAGRTTASGAAIAHTQRRMMAVAMWALIAMSLVINPITLTDDPTWRPVAGALWCVIVLAVLASRWRSLPARESGGPGFFASMSGLAGVLFAVGIVASIGALYLMIGPISRVPMAWMLLGELAIATVLTCGVMMAFAGEKAFDYIPDADGLG